VIFELTNKIIQ